MTGEADLTEEQSAMLETLAEMIIPADDFDNGLQGAGFAGIMETRNMYQPWMAKLYDTGLKGINQISNILFGKRFLDLEGKERASVLEKLNSENPGGSVWTEQESASAFFTNLCMDACFVYCTDEEVWKRIGFPGSIFEKGGYPDFAEPQE
jgi:hypothetical protein